MSGRDEGRETETSIDCPYCALELSLPEEGDAAICPSCGRRVDVPSQQAFLRAETAFLSVANEVARFAWQGDGRSVFRAKAAPDSLPLPSGIIRAYQQAYSGLRIALEGALSEDQLLSAVKMLAEITRLFAPRAMVSPLEAEYWSKRTVVAVARQELASIRESLALKPGSPVGSRLQRIHLRVRRRQLRRVSARLDAQLQELELAIGFVSS
ncbi:MAG: hypothetical protein JXC32_21890 [Anaerolineae bacterium]|nr:hypothetical protein [Anaerolineae bacterium]